MNGGQGGRHHAGLGGVVKAAEPDIIRDGDSHLFKYLQGIQCHKVVGAEENFRKFVYVLEAFCQVFLIVNPLRPADFHVLADKAPFLPAGQPCQVHGVAVGHVALTEGLAVQVLPDETDALLSPADHFPHQAVDAGPVFHIETVCPQGSPQTDYGRIGKQDGRPQAAEHFGVIPVKHLHADDSGSLILMIGSGQLQGIHHFYGNPVHGKAVAQLGELPLEFVQHGGGKVGISDEARGKQCDFPGGRGRLRFFSGTRNICIGKLLVAHFHGFLEDFFPGGVRQEPGVVDGLGNRVPGYAKGICNVLYCNSFCHIHFSVSVLLCFCCICLFLRSK